MRYLPSDRYNVAWFKLAECVSRGEKERALGVYRLLSHSFDDEAFACQLEGDILFSFDDKDGAIEKYRQSVDLYQKDERLLEAAAVCEHLLTLAPSKQEYITQLIDLYRLLKISSKVVTYLKISLALLLGNDDLEGALRAMDQLDRLLDVGEISSERQQLVFALLKNDFVPRERISMQVRKTVDGLFVHKDGKALQRFLFRLEKVSEACYLDACQHMEKSDIQVSE